MRKRTHTIDLGELVHVLCAREGRVYVHWRSIAWVWGLHGRCVVVEDEMVDWREEEEDGACGVVVAGSSELCHRVRVSRTA